MANTVLGTHGSGVHGSRPAGNAVPDGSLYSCSTHSLIYVSSYGGNSWATWASLSGTGLADPMSLRGDIITRDSTNTTNRLAKGSAGQVLTSDGTDVLWKTTGSASYRRAASTGNYTTTSTTFADIDNSNMNFTITTGARRVECAFSGAVKNSGNTFNVYLDIDLDGARLGAGDGGIMRFSSNPAGAVGNGSFVYLTDVLSAGSHTFKFQWRVDGNTGTIINTGTDQATIVRASVTELA